MLLVTISTVQANTVNISGVVKDSKKNALVSGADVKLKKLGMSTTTNNDGAFSFTKTSINEIANKMHIVRDGNLTFSLESDGNVNIRISDLSGRVHSMLSNSKLQQGTWKLVPPTLQPGLYVCTFKTEKENFSVRYLTSKNSIVSNGAVRKDAGSSDMSHGDVMTLEKMQTSNNVDTIVVTKSGYKAAQVGLSSYSKTYLNIALEEETASGDDATIVPDPSWICYMAAGIPPPQLGKLAFKVTMQIDKVYTMGKTQFGDRQLIVIKSGTIKGDKIDATLLNGGMDMELTLSTGSKELEQINIFKTKENNPVLMRNAGVAPSGSTTVRTVFDFEASNSSSYGWLNSGKFVGNRIVDTVAEIITFDVYDISSVTNPEKKVQIKDPDGVTNQTWDCVTLNGNKSTSVVFTETVSLGGSVSIGASKRGSRNIIPITGGKTTGKVNGNILNCGADYQLSGLDARYALAPNDGEIILVRNCGPMDKLIPVFEAKASGNYAFLNKIAFFSSAPGGAGSGVSITFYEKQ
jgi:hypothetical protein